MKSSQQHIRYSQLYGDGLSTGNDNHSRSSRREDTVGDNRADVSQSSVGRASQHLHHETPYADHAMRNVDEMTSTPKEKSPAVTRHDLRAISSDRHRPWYAIWGDDIGAILLSCIFLLLSIGVLKALDGQQYFAWHISSVAITPNALISIIATIFKIFLFMPIANGIAQMRWVYFQQSNRAWNIQLFDDASRGPLGALKLLYQLNIKSLVACLGALITLLVLALEPLYQQVIAYETNPVIANNMTATISVSKIAGLSTFSSDTSNDNAELTIALTSALIRSAQDALYDCPASRCEWDPYESIGICSTCSDLTQETVLSCEDIIVPVDGVNFTAGNYTTSFCNYTFKSAPTVFWNLWDISDGEMYAPIIGLNSTVFFDRTTNDSSSHPSGMTIMNDVANVISIDFNDGGKLKNSLEAAKAWKPSVTLCHIHVCERTYGASSYSSGFLHDDTTSNVTMLSDLTNCAQTDGGHDNFTLHQICPAFRSDQAPPLPLPVSILNSRNNTLADVLSAAPSVNYWVDFSLIAELITVFANSFIGLGFYGDGVQIAIQGNETMSDGVTGLYYLLHSNGNQTQPWYNTVPKTLLDFARDTDVVGLLGSAATTAADTVLGAYYLKTNRTMSAKMNDVTTSLTNLIRQGAYSTSVEGAVILQTVFIRVHWLWLVFPIGILVLTALFLSLVIYISHEKHVYVWKASSLALSFHGMETDQQTSRLSSMQGMERAARNMNVKVMQAEDGRISLHLT